MSRIKHGRPSPAILVAVIALVAALVGTAAAGPSVTTSVSKNQTKKIAKKQGKKQAKKYFNNNIGSASVANANTANTANALSTGAVVYEQATKTLPSFGLDFILLFCPSGTQIASTGSTTDSIPLVNEQSFDPATNSGVVWYIDIFDSGTSTIGAQIACLKTSPGSSTASSTLSATDKQAVIAEARDKRERLLAERPELR